ncbi:MAG: tetratricopeptide repeat protein [Bacteroidota bacterium]
MSIKRFFSVLTIALAWLYFGCNSDNVATTNEKDTAMIGTTGDPAIDGLTRQIQAMPNDAGLYGARGQLFYDNKVYDEAITDLTKAIRLDSTNADYYHVLADVYLEYSRSRLGLKTMEAAAKQFPKRIPTLLKLAEIQLILQKNDESLRTIGEVLKIDPQSGDAFFLMGNNFKEKKDIERAINSFQTAVENDPDLIDAWLNLGRLFTERNNPIAEQYFNSAVRVDSSNIEALHAKAYYLGNIKDDLDGALDIYRKIVLLDPYYEEAYFNSGLLYLDKNDLAAAQKQFDLTVKNSPTHIRGYYYRGLTAELQGDVETARANYEQALRMYPEYENAQNRLNGLISR